MSKLKRNALKLTRPAFKAWLESLHPRTKVGMPDNVRSCPIARFVIHQTSNRDINVTRDRIKLNSSKFGTSDHEHYEQIFTPHWASNFIRHVDQTYNVGITASQALKILKSSRSK